MVSMRLEMAAEPRHAVAAWEEVSGARRVRVAVVEQDFVA